jgi:hypothetical protein
MRESIKIVLLFCLVIVVFFILHTVRFECNRSSRYKIWTRADQQQNVVKTWVDNFHEIATQYGTDKVTIHAYQHLYGLYLGPIRYERLALLEIGLGCNVNFTAGASLNLWKTYLPRSQFDILEFNSTCAERFKDQMNQLFVGDQSSFELLKRIAVNSYDVIVDDGGHSRRQQINSLIGLWSSVKPSGLYIIEDIFTSMMDKSGYNDYPVSTVELINHLIVMFSARTSPFRVSHLDLELNRIHKDLLSVNCFAEICVLIKK